MLKLVSFLLLTSKHVISKKGSPTAPAFTPSEKLYATLDWSWSGNDYEVKSIDKNLRFKIKQKVISIGHDFEIENAAGSRIAKVDEDILTLLGPKYKVSFTDSNGSQKTARINRQYSWGFPTAYKSFDISIDGGESFTTHGDILAWKFSIAANNDGKTVAKVEIQGQDFVKINFPGAQVYEIGTDTSRISNTIPMALLNIVQWLARSSKSW